MNGYLFHIFSPADEEFEYNATQLTILKKKKKNFDIFIYEYL